MLSPGTGTSASSASVFRDIPGMQRAAIRNVRKSSRIRTRQSEQIPTAAVAVDRNFHNLLQERFSKGADFRVIPIGTIDFDQVGGAREYIYPFASKEHIRPCHAFETNQTNGVPPLNPGAGRHETDTICYIASSSMGEIAKDDPFQLSFAQFRLADSISNIYDTQTSE